ncbi:ATP-dependent rRNA helicase spb4 [Tulasnella sp. 417]|nr:ATP-dependent rRNA helicase spb4 [Tulasnella sp. 417]
MKNKDVIVEAVTGSGKTLAFVIPVIERLIRREKKFKKNEVGALIISPTRELATQIHSIFSLFLNSQPSLLSPPSPSPPPPSEQPPSRPVTPPPPPAPEYPPPLLLVSGQESSNQNDIVRFLETGADIVVGTPGRIEEFLLSARGRKTVDVKSIEVVVLDEADRLLDLGFSQSLTAILGHLPKIRRTGLFSATMTEGLSEIVRVGLRNPVRVVVKVEAKANGVKRKAGAVEERRIPAKLSNTYMMVHPSEKLLQLVRLLLLETVQLGQSRIIVYFATCAEVTYFYKILKGLPCLSYVSLFSLHGHIPPAKRAQSLSSFSTHPSTSLTPSVLLCTDVAARGLDIPLVDLVVQFDPPVDPKVFAHRVGRTARAGMGGRAVVLLCGRPETLDVNEEQKQEEDEEWGGVGAEGEGPLQAEASPMDGDRDETTLKEVPFWGREGEYVPFLAVRKIPLQERPYITADEVAQSWALHDSSMEVDQKPQSPETLVAKNSRPDLEAQLLKKQVQQLVLQDRDLHEKGIVAFVSFVRAYSKHEAAYIFRLQDLDLVGVASSFGLIKLPIMPELKAAGKKDGWELVEFDEAALSYASGAREAARLARMENPKPAKSTRKKPNEAWSEKKAKLAAKAEKREKRQKKKEWLAKVKSGEVVPESKERNPEDETMDNEAQHGGSEEGSSLRKDPVTDQADWEEIEREERAAKKLRRAVAAGVGGSSGPVVGNFDDL